MESGQALMRCRYCNIALAPSRSFVDGEFCCDAHRQAFESQEPIQAEHAEPEAPTALQRLRLRFAPRPLERPSEIAEPETAIPTEPEFEAEAYTVEASAVDPSGVALAEPYAEQAYAEAEEESV